MARQQHLLRERRAACLELARCTDPTTRSLIQFEIDSIDRRLHEMTEPSVVHVGGEWSPAHHTRQP